MGEWSPMAPCRVEPLELLVVRIGSQAVPRKLQNCSSLVLLPEESDFNFLIHP